MLFIVAPTDPVFTIDAAALAELQKASQMGLFGGETHVKEHVRRRGGKVETVHEHTRAGGPHVPEVPHAPTAPKAPKVRTGPGTGVDASIGESMAPGLAPLPPPPAPTPRSDTNTGSFGHGVNTAPRSPEHEAIARKDSHRHKRAQIDELKQRARDIGADQNTTSMARTHLMHTLYADPTKDADIIAQEAYHGALTKVIEKYQPKPKPDPTPALVERPATDERTHLPIHAKLLTEFTALEADTFEPHRPENKPARGQADFVDAVKNAAGGKLRLTPDALHYLRTEALPNAMDIWEDQGEKTLLRAGKELEATLPPASAMVGHGKPMGAPPELERGNRTSDVAFMAALSPQKRKALSGAMLAYNVPDGMAKIIHAGATKHVNKHNLDTAYRMAAEPHMVPDKRDMSQNTDADVDHYLGLKRTHPALHAGALMERERRGDAYADKIKAAGWTDEDIGVIARHNDGTNFNQSLLQHDANERHAKKLWTAAGLPMKANGDMDHNRIVRHALETEADKRGWTSAQGAGQRYNRKPDAPPWPPPAPVDPGAPKSEREKHIDAMRENNRRINDIANHPDTKPWHARAIREHLVDERALENVHRTSMDLADLRQHQEEGLKGR